MVLTLTVTAIVNYSDVVGTKLFLISDLLTYTILIDYKKDNWLISQLLCVHTFVLISLCE